MTTANKCIHFCTNSEQGYGFTEFDGSWPMPELEVNSLQIIDANDTIRTIIFDITDEKFYEIGLKETYSDVSNHVLYRDKISIDESTYTEITPSVIFKEDTGEYEKYIINHDGSSFYLRPVNADHINASGFDSQGFVSGTKFNINIYPDGDETKTYYTAIDISRDSDVTYDKYIEGHRLLTKVAATKSGFRIIGRQQEFIVKDINYGFNGDPNTENIHQEELSDPLLWVTRGENYNKDIINDVTISGISGQVDGPDGYTNSALLCPYNSSFSLGTISSTNPKTFCVWASGTAPYLTWNGASGRSYLNTFQALDSTLYGWRLSYFSGITTNGTLELWSYSTPLKVFDIRMQEGFSTENLQYLFDDVKNNQGNNTLPLY